MSRKIDCRRSRKIAAVTTSIVMFGFGMTSDALACRPTESSLRNRPLLEAIISSNPIVFIGSVIASGWPEEKVMIGNPPREVYRPRTWFPVPNATIKIEIPIRGVTGDTIEIRQGLPGVCENEFNTGQRWFFAGNTEGSSYFSGATVLIDELGRSSGTGALGADHDEIKKMFPEVLSLPTPQRR